MFFPENLYLLSPRDQQVTWLDPVFVRVNSGAILLTTVTVQLYVVPQGRALILQSAVVSAIAGAAQVSSVQFLDVAPPGAGAAPVIARQEPEVPTQGEAMNWSGSLIVPPGWIINAGAGFSGAAAGNSVDGTIIGILIPIGNVQR